LFAQVLTHWEEKKTTEEKSSDEIFDFLIFFIQKDLVTSHRREMKFSQESIESKESIFFYKKHLSSSFQRITVSNGALKKASPSTFILYKLRLRVDQGSAFLNKRNMS
jgi:hypothetical protein